MEVSEEGECSLSKTQAYKMHQPTSTVSEFFASFLIV